MEFDINGYKVNLSGVGIPMTDSEKEELIKENKLTNWSNFYDGEMLWFSSCSSTANYDFKVYVDNKNKTVKLIQFSL